MQYRQGDLLIELTDEQPRGEVTTERLVLRGEGRDHGHFLTGDCEIFSASRFEEDEQLSHFVRVNGQCVVEHLLISTGNPTREHDPIPLKPGTYRIIRQREYNPYARAIRLIRD